nr:hypothetical protein [uncultured Campylobacter sp.]
MKRIFALLLLATSIYASTQGKYDIEETITKDGVTVASKILQGTESIYASDDLYAQLVFNFFSISDDLPSERVKGSCDNTIYDQRNKGMLIIDGYYYLCKKTKNSQDIKCGNNHEELVLTFNKTGKNNTYSLNFIGKNIELKKVLDQKMVFAIYDTQKIERERFLGEYEGIDTILEPLFGDKTLNDYVFNKNFNFMPAYSSYTAIYIAGDKLGLKYNMYCSCQAGTADGNYAEIEVFDVNGKVLDNKYFVNDYSRFINHIKYGGTTGFNLDKYYNIRIGEYRISLYPYRGRLYLFYKNIFEKNDPKYSLFRDDSHQPKAFYYNSELQYFLSEDGKKYIYR